MRYIGNGFSSRMITGTKKIVIEDVDVEDVPFQHCKSIVGHEQVAKDLGVEYNREFVTLKAGDVLYVATPKSNERLSEQWKYKSDGYNFQRIYVDD